MKIFEVNTEIYVGDKFDEVIEKIKAKKALIVTDSIMYKLGMTKKFENIFNKKNIEYKIFDEVEVDPSFEVVDKALNKVIDFLPDIIVGIGGGSSLDTAKSIKYFVKKSGLSIPLIALPTTSGTGSEVSSYAVLTDKKNKIIEIKNFNKLFILSSILKKYINTLIKINKRNVLIMVIFLCICIAHFLNILSRLKNN